MSCSLLSDYDSFKLPSINLLWGGNNWRIGCNGYTERKNYGLCSKLHRTAKRSIDVHFWRIQPSFHLNQDHEGHLLIDTDVKWWSKIMIPDRATLARLHYVSYILAFNLQFAKVNVQANVSAKLDGGVKGRIMTHSKKSWYWAHMSRDVNPTFGSPPRDTM